MSRIYRDINNYISIIMDIIMKKYFSNPVILAIWAIGLLLIMLDFYFLLEIL